MPSTKQEQGGAGGKVRSAIGALKRLPLIRRTTPSDRPPSVAGRRRSGPESASEEEAGPQPASPTYVSMQESDLAATTNPTSSDGNAPPSPATSVRSSRAPRHKLNSSTPASELPKSWSEWNWAYQNGYIDFDDPPPPPGDLWASDFVTQSGTFKPPRPANEIKRQRAVDSLNVLPPSRDSELPTSPQSPTRDSAAASDEARAASDPSFDGESAGGRDGGSAGSSVLRQKPGGGKRTKRQLGPLHPALQQLATEAKQRFGVDATTVSLMSNDHQIFLGDSTCKFIEETDKLERDSTCCAHTMLKASTTGTQEPLVVLDFAKDWRFRKNGFAPYDKGFYAAAPILVPAPLGDDEADEHPAGVFCLLGEQPRTGFDERDRRELSQMAERASVVIRRYVEEQRRMRSAALAQKQSSWRRSDKVRRARRAQVTFEPTVVVTPPSTDVVPPPLRTSSGSDDSEQPPTSKRPSSETDELIVQLPSAEQPRRVKRAPLPIQTSSLAPARFERTTSEEYQYAGTALSATLDGDVRDAFDLSTELVATSIEMDFAYIARFDVHSSPLSDRKASPHAPATDGSSPSSPVEMISSFGRSHPAPQFSREAHLALEHAADDVVLYVRPDDSLREARERGDVLTTGLLAKIATAGDQTYVLGCFSQEIRRVLNLEDVEFVKSFARDLVQYVPAFEEAAW